MKSIPNHVLVLPDIRSAQNVGSLFRTADAAGLGTVYITGISATPIDKYGRPNSSVVKTSLGAEHSVAWQYVESLGALLDTLRKEGYTFIAIEQSPDAFDYKKVEVTGPTAFIMGNEIDGLPKEILERVDIIAEIPMKGDKESLNVSVAGGIAMFRILNI